ncbi:MAG: twin-arginine translocase subunit TatC [Bacteroidales bacterium]|nr:twin-arginine translocase subunit TatC [Bacteroidales bacterium]
MAQEQNKQLEEMSLWDHVDALRAVLFKMAAVLVVAAGVLFVLMPDIFDQVILAPCHGDFVLYRLFADITAGIPSLPQFSTEGFEVKLINIQLASQFFIHMSTSFWLALVVTFPVMLYFLWTFVSPALYPEEKKGFRKAFALGNVMFILGLMVGYFLVFPITLRFLADYRVSELIPNQISLDSYMDTFLMLIFIMGIVFEMPLLAWLIGKMGILTRGFFAKFRRHAIVILLILAAIITPTGDPFTLTVVFLPIYLLYELSAFLVPAKKAESEEDTAQ